jgi:signal transduction histidine kinase
MESIDLRLALDALRQEHREALTATRSKALRELSIGLRHEINNGLQSIVLHADILRTGDGLGDEQGRCAAVVQAEALKIAEILQRLCNVESLGSRPYAGGETMIDLSPRGT